MLQAFCRGRVRDAKLAAVLGHEQEHLQEGRPRNAHASVARVLPQPLVDRLPRRLWGPSGPPLTQLMSAVSCVGTSITMGDCELSNARLHVCTVSAGMCTWSVCAPSRASGSDN
jgi:hypothetical protein